MPFNDLPMSVLFLIFLWIFLLIGFVPVWKRARAKMRLLRKQSERAAPESDHWQERGTRSTGYVPGGRLNDYETMVLRRLAQAGPRGLGRKQLRGELLLDAELFKTTMRSLNERGMVEVFLTIWRGIRFHLSRSGHDYAVTQGFIPTVHIGG